jgi:hypothetical protein
MAASHGSIGSEHTEVASSAPSLNESSLLSKSISNGIYDKAIIQRNTTLAWMGDFQSIKDLVAEYFELDGQWDSPGGEKKVFYCGGIATITWMKKRKLLQIEGPNARLIKRNLLSVLLCEDTGFDSTTNESPTTTICHLGCSCGCKELSVDIEGMKLDMTIVESRQERAIAGNTLALDQVKAEVKKLSSKFEVINCMLSDSNRVKLDSDARKDEAFSRLRDDNNVLRNENDLLLNTVEVLTHELSESRAMVKSNESMDDVVVTYANSLPVAGAALPDSIEINYVQATGEQDQLTESCTSIISEMQNT